MLELLLPAFVFFFGSWLVTLLLLRLSRERLRFLRLLPLLAVLALWALAWKEYHAPSLFGGLNTLAALAKAAGGVFVLIGWAIPMMLHFWKRRRT